MASIAKAVEEYMMRNPAVKHCISRGMINFSSLSRRIIREKGLDSSDFDAVLIACRRYRDEAAKQGAHTAKAKDILAKSRLEVKTGIVVFVIEKDVYFDLLIDVGRKIKREREMFQVIEGTDTITLITTKQFSKDIKDMFSRRIITENPGLAEIVIKTSKDIERTPGVVSYLASLLGAHDINIFETMSTWTDTLFIISENDIEKALGVLKF